MKIEAAIQLLTPGQFEVAKQDWRRDPTTWRRAFLLNHLTPRISGISNPHEAAALRSKWHDSRAELQ